MTSTQKPVFSVKNLDVRFSTPDGEIHAVKGTHFAVHKGECLGIVGESGSGKSQTVLAAMGLLAANGKVSGEARFQGQDLITLKRRALNQLRGEKLSMIFQDPLTSLTPHIAIGDQMREVLARHKNIKGASADQICKDWLERVRIPEATRRLAQFPHELSGGMRQRVMIAMSMLCEPELLIADEPTTALDVTVQAQVLELMDELKRELGTAIILITHDMGVVARMCDQVNVMRYGEIIEEGDIDDIFYNPQHDYTKMLLDAMPRLDDPSRHGRPSIEPLTSRDALLDVDDIKVYFDAPGTGGLLSKPKPLKAVDGVSFEISPGETVGIVGESGCGKSTLARGVLQLIKPTDGAVAWLGRDMTKLHDRHIRALRDDLQIVFQDPLASLDPRMTIGRSIAEPLTVFKPQLNRFEREALVKEMMEKTGLNPNMINRYPHELSGGQNQRVGIARAMILRPKFVVCDEAVSALDVSVQAQIIDLLITLQKEFDLAIMFISHDLSVVREISHRIMVLYLGRVVEMADRDQIYEDARHPYTKALISAVPTPDPKKERARPRIKLEGDLPSPLDSRAGLRFMKSALIDDSEAEQYRPELVQVEKGHYVAEHDASELSPGLVAKEVAA